MLSVCSPSCGSAVLTDPGVVCDLKGMPGTYIDIVYTSSRDFKFRAQDSVKPFGIVWMVVAIAKSNTASQPYAVYRQRNPQSSPYYQCVEEHFEVFEQVYEDRFERQYVFIDLMLDE